MENLKKSSANAKVDTLRINLMNNIAVFSFAVDMEQTKKYAEKALAESEKIGYEKGIADACNYLGNYYLNNPSYNALNNFMALKYFDKEMVFAKKKNDIERLELLSNNIAKVLEKMFDYKTAIATLQKNILEANNKIQQATSNQNIANIYALPLAYDKG